MFHMLVTETKYSLNREISQAKKAEWGTPPEIFDPLNKEFHFTLDACASKHNAKCDMYFTEEDNGLEQDWSGHTVFCCPPSGRCLYDWVSKARHEQLRHRVTTVMLIPNASDTKYFAEFIYDFSRMVLRSGVEVRPLPHRVKFVNVTLDSYENGNVLRRSVAPRPSIIVVFHGH